MLWQSDVDVTISKSVGDMSSNVNDTYTIVLLLTQMTMVKGKNMQLVFKVK